MTWLNDITLLNDDDVGKPALAAGFDDMCAVPTFNSPF